MLSVKLRTLAAMLTQRPDLASAIAANIEELADCASHLEHSSVAPGLMAPSELPISGDNVVRLARKAGR
jgi:hypothetical protein